MAGDLGIGQTAAVPGSLPGHASGFCQKRVQNSRPNRREHLLSILRRHAVLSSAAAPLLLTGSAAAWPFGPKPADPGDGGGGPPGSGSNAGCSVDAWDGGSSSQDVLKVASGRRSIMLTMASFAVTRRAYSRITQLFNHEYKEKTGVDVRFRMTFGGSGAQARAVIDGLPAEIVSLALPSDVIKIAEAGLMDPDWASKFPRQSIPMESVVCIVTRKGNPHHIRGWEDLTRPGLKVIVANAKTAGVARWIFLALWGVHAARGDKAAIKYVTGVYDNVFIQPRDAREASDVFYKQRRGDVLLTYENEAVFTNLIQCPVALVDHHVDENGLDARLAATAFINYLYTPTAQKHLVGCGFRTHIPELAAESKLPTVKKLWTVEKRLGTWQNVTNKFFSSKGILDQIQTDVAVRQHEQRTGKKIQMR